MVKRTTNTRKLEQNFHHLIDSIEDVKMHSTIR